MRVPVKRSSAKPRKETPEDVLAAELVKIYEVQRDITFEEKGPAGTNSFVAGIALPKYKTIVELQGKQDNKSILAEMKRERIARASGWIVSRVAEKDLLSDVDSVLYRVRRDIERSLWK